MPVDPVDCPFYKAPACFRYALTRSIEAPLDGFTPTNWRGFSQHFMIKLAEVIATPEELVDYWIDHHPLKDENTIRLAMKYAEEMHHKLLLDRLNELIKSHCVPDATHQTTPSESLRACEKCQGWDSEQYFKTKRNETPNKVNCEHNHISINGPITNNIYLANGNLDLQTPNEYPNSNEKPKSPSNTTATSCEKDVIQELGYNMFDVFPYRLLRAVYYGRKKEIIRIIIVLYLLYQGLAVVMMSLCENGGLSAMFRAENKYNAVISRLIAFTLRFLLRVVTPLCCCLQIPNIASKPNIPRFGLPKAEALQRIFKVHEKYSSEEETAELKRRPKDVLERSEEMIKRRIKAIWIPMTNAAFLVTLLLYLGAFLACESNTIRGGVCKSLDKTIITLPFIEYQFHLIIMVESLSVFGAVLLIGIVANCYYHENTLAKYASTIGKEVDSFHLTIRRRWAVMDMYTISVPMVLSAVTILSLSTGRSFTPHPKHQLEANELVDWYFWVIIITVLQYLGFACNRMIKSACLFGYLLAGVFLYWVEVEISMVPFGSILVLLYSGLSAICCNLLYSLGSCHFCHAQENGSASSYFWCMCCVLCVLSLLSCLVVTFYREIAHLTVLNI